MLTGFRHAGRHRNTFLRVAMLTTRNVQQPEGITEERLERALEVLSALVSEHGEKHAPLRSMIEGQLSELRARGTPPVSTPAYAVAS